MKKVQRPQNLNGERALQETNEFRMCGKCNERLTIFFTPHGNFFCDKCHKDCGRGAASQIEKSDWEFHFPVLKGLARNCFCVPLAGIDLSDHWIAMNSSIRDNFTLDVTKSGFGAPSHVHISGPKLEVTTRIRC